MSNFKITDLSSLSQSALDASADFLLAVDVSDTAMSASGTNVKITPKSLVGGSINDLIQTWNSGATVFTGLKLNVTDTASDADSSLMDLQIGGSSKFRVKKDGDLIYRTATNNLVRITSSGGEGAIVFGNNTNTTTAVMSTTSASANVRFSVGGNNRLDISGSSVSVNSANLWLNGATLEGASHTLELRSAANAQRFNLYGTYTDASNYRRLYISSTTGGAFTIGIEGLGTGASGNTLTIANAVIFGGSITGAQIVTNTNGFQTPIGGNGYAFNSGGYFICSSNGVFKISNWADNDFGRLQLGGTTSSFPAIKRNSTALNFRLADDSADCPITAAAATFSGNVTISSAVLSNSSLIFGTTSNPGLSSSANGLLVQHWGSNYHSFNYGIMRSARGAGSTGFAGIAGSPNAASVDGPDSYFLNTALCTWEMYGVTGSNSNTLRIYRDRTDSSNYSRFYINTNASASKYEIGTQRAGTGGSFGIDFIVNGTKMIDFNAGNVDIYFSQRSITWGSANSGEVRLKQKTAFSSRLDVVDAAGDNNYSSFVLAGIWFWGTTSAHPYLKRSSTTLQARLGDDTGFGSFQGKITTETNYTAGAPTATGYLILYDATGTAYRVPAVLN